MNIIHQTQPTENSCVSATIAMILSIPVENVVEEFHERYFEMQSISVSEYLFSKGVRTIPGLTSYMILEWERVYLLCVPSINEVAAFHSLLVDTRGQETVIYDPAMGREGKKYYVLQDPENELEIKLKAYNIHYEVMP